MIKTKKVFFSGSHGSGKTSITKEIAKRLQKTGISVYVVPEMSFPFIAPIGTIDFQLRYKRELEIRSEIINYIAEMGYFDFILCDRALIDVHVYTGRILMTRKVELTDKVTYPEMVRGKNEKYFLLTCNPKEIKKRLDKRNQSEANLHRVDWKETDIEYLKDIQNIFLLDTIKSSFDHIIENDKFEVTVDKILTYLYFMD